MNPEIIKILTTLAEKLNTTIEKLSIVLMRQIYIDTIINSIWIVIIGLNLYICGKYLWERNKEYKDGIIIIFNSIYIISLLIFIPCFISTVYDLPTLIFNPEYLMIERIGSLFRK